jgi:hypothetical protein
MLAGAPRPGTAVDAVVGAARLTLQAVNQRRAWFNSQQKSTPIHVIHMVKKCRTGFAGTRCVEVRTKT